MKVSHLGKMGDLMYALPVMRALARIYDTKIELVTSGLCWQLVPLLWEQPYISEITLDDQAHEIVDHIFPKWDVLPDGINLSLQPQYYEPISPVTWTHCYMKAACVDTLTKQDCVGLPSLVNHRRWLYGIHVELDGKRLTPPNTVIVAPECESLAELRPEMWQEIIDMLLMHHHVVVVGTRQSPDYEGVTDLRGKTSVPVMARMIAEARYFIGAHSFPWHIARHAEVPALCIQSWREAMIRLLPVDTPYWWVEPEHWEEAVMELLKHGQAYTSKAPGHVQGGGYVHRQAN